MHIIGTAGHVDHGKSALVNALTGTNPDRWLEEQLRGMTLDLGFAHLRFDDGTEAGIVDVPGHERFLHNMLAGAAGMELLLLVVDAGEGVMPQTFEHLQILQYLNVRDIIVVVTKIDVLASGEAGAACKRIETQLQGTIARDASIIAVSSRTAANMEILREAIRQRLRALPARDPDAPAYLPVDRVFALPGHGTIVTGTLMQGRIAVGDTLTLQPSQRNVRVRSLQSFGEKRERVEGGARVAVNIPAVGARDIARGEMLVAPQFSAAQAFAVTFTPAADALALLRRRNAVRAYIGSAEILGTLVFEQTPHTAQSVNATLLLQRPTVAYPGAAFVVRRLSPKNVLGGGRLHAPAAAHHVSDSASTAETAALAVLHSRRTAMTAAEIARETNLREDALAPALDRLAGRGEIVRVQRPAAFVDAQFAENILAGALEFLQEQHRGEPWALGATSLALARALAVDEALLLRILSAFADEGRIRQRAGYFSAPDFIPHLSDAQEQFFREALGSGANGSLVPAPLDALVKSVRASRVPGIARAFDTLIATGVIVKIGDEVYRGSQIAAIRARMERFFERNAAMTMAQFRDLVGTSRKYAVPLLEWFDARGVTVRSEDLRMLRAPQANRRANDEYAKISEPSA